MSEIELQVNVGILTARLNVLEDSINSAIVSADLRLKAIETEWEGFQGERALLPTNGQARLDGLERVAVDAISTARKCITDALQRHEDRLDALEKSSRMWKSFSDEVKSKDDGKVAGGVIKYARGSRRL